MRRPTSRVVEKLYSAIIADQPVIVPRPLELGLERFHRPAQLLVTVSFDPIGHPLYSGLPFLGGRASFHPRFALPIWFPVKLESQKIKPPIMRPAIVPEAQRFGLVRRYFQPKLGPPLFQPFLKGSGLMPIFKARHKIIRIPNHPAAS